MTLPKPSPKSTAQVRTSLIKVRFHIPKGSGILFENDKYMWHYTTTPFGPNPHTEMWMRGRVIGGSSSINGMVYNRGNRADYDELERLGNRGWGWDEILPIFTGFEDNEFGSSPTRGVGGAGGDDAGSV